METHRRSQGVETRQVSWTTSKGPAQADFTQQQDRLKLSSQLDNNRTSQ